MQYRSRSRIISDVLSKASGPGVEGGSNISGLMRSCNLSYANAVSLLGELVGAGLLTEVQEEKSVRYHLSERGLLFLEKYQQLEEFVESYGLRL